MVQPATISIGNAKVSVISLITAVLVKQRKKERKSAVNVNEREEKEKALENKRLDK